MSMAQSDDVRTFYLDRKPSSVLSWMQGLYPRWPHLILCLLLFSCAYEIPKDIAEVWDKIPDQIDFNFHIRPILSDRCYSCHGPDDDGREADLRLDVEDAAFGRLGEGGHPFVKGDLSKSVVWQRINTDDPEQTMPPPESHLDLTVEQRALIGKWILQGAQWKEHWSFIPPAKSDVPVGDEGWVINEIDHFILRKLREVGLEPSARADKERLIRRVTMDLTGLPPTIADIDAFLEDRTADAYEKLVDRLLNTDAHAERLTLEWLDVARYADTHGMHADGLRIMWPWRDWVISAFRSNLPYHDFIKWQLAGDLLPGATTEQKLATGFHRNHVANSESGIVPEEFRLQYVADRTNTTAAAFLGLTMECASCHDHKFDPVTQKEFYQMSAFFNNVHELGMIGTDQNFGPTVLLPSEETKQLLTSLDSQITSVKGELNKLSVDPDRLEKYANEKRQQQVVFPSPDGYYPFDWIARRDGDRQFVDDNTSSPASGELEIVPGRVANAIRIDDDYDRIRLAGVGNFNVHEPFSGGAWINIEEVGTFQTIMTNIGGKNDGWRGWIFYLDSIGRPGVKIVHSLSHNYLHIVGRDVVTTDAWNHLFFTYNGSGEASGLSIFVNGESIDFDTLFNHLYKNILPVKHRNYTPDYDRMMRLGHGSEYLFSEKDNGVFIGAFDQVRIFHRYLTSIEVARMYSMDVGKDVPWSPTSDQIVHHYLHREDQQYQALSAQLLELFSRKMRLMDPVMEVMVMADKRIPRKTYVLERGRYDVPGEEVTASTPTAIRPMFGQRPKNRLGLAQWILDPEHPLTARVTVNRYWQMIFGRGLVETVHDFGSQGALPSHPALLDWLALYFQDGEWDLRALLKLMVMSATYQQTAESNRHKNEVDPENIFLSRGPTYRWPAEMIRDNALAASGLLNKKVGGESVKPYQPPDLWKDKNEFSGYLNNYQQDTGQDLYRRSMYTFIRRTSPPPAMMAFDATNRAICVVKRDRTSTPLQALVLMNDPQFVEAARVLAVRMQKEGGDSLDEQLRYAFRRLCGRRPDQQEVETLTEQYHTEVQKYRKNPAAASALLRVGEYEMNEAMDEVHTAALAMVTSTIINFDETYMKR